MIFKSLSLLACIAALPLASAKAPRASEPVADTWSCSQFNTVAPLSGSPPVVDGVLSKGEYSDASSVPLFRAGDTTKDILATASVITDCAKWYVLVQMDTSNTVLFEKHKTGEQFVKINDQMMVNELGNFKWLDDGSGWEASFDHQFAPNTDLNIYIHALVETTNGEQDQTAGSVPCPLNHSCEAFTTPAPTDPPTAPPTSPPTDPEPLATAPPTECGDNSQCQPDSPAPCMMYFCNAGTCDSKPKAVDTPCGAAETACMESGKCNASGQCLEPEPKAFKTPCGNQEAMSCSDADYCDGNGTCLPNHKPDGESCGAPPDQCSKGYSCSKGECIWEGHLPAGTSCGPETLLGPCDAADQCDGSGKCVDQVIAKNTVCKKASCDCELDAKCDGYHYECPTNPIIPDGTSCGDKIGECDKGYTCSSGKCEHLGFLAPTTPCGTAPTSECMVQGYCNTEGGCDPPQAKPAGTACGAAETECMTGGTCSADGQCLPPQPKQVGTECGLAETDCMYSGKCNAEGSCLPPEPKPLGEICGDQMMTSCSDGDVCDGKGKCMGNDKPDGTKCGADETECKLGHSCSIGECVFEGNKDDGTPCGNDATECDKGSSCSDGSCVHLGFMPATTICGKIETSECMIQGHCDAAGGCVASTPKAEGTACGAAETECMTGGSCSADGVCLPPQPKGVMTKCGLAETECMHSGMCSADGTCLPPLPKDPGTSCGNPLVTACSLGDVCDGSGTCIPNDKPDGTSCGAPPDQCSKGSKCNSGECIFLGFMPTGTSCGTGELSGPCDKLDTCDGAGGCSDHVEPETTVCREAASDCDVAEYCDGSSKSCPEDGFKAIHTACGDTEEGECTAADTCDGQGICLPNHINEGDPCGAPEDQCNFASSCHVGECVFGGYKSTSTACGTYDALDLCDKQDYCDGAGKCNEQVKDAGFVCRPAGANQCDVDDVCDGVSKSCPVDEKQPVGTLCGNQMDTECTDPDTCDGNGNCLDNHVADGSSCGAPEDQCNLAHSCSKGECIFLGYKPDSTPCGTYNPEDACDVQDFCDGAGTCKDKVEPSGTVCREAASECDVAEICDGVAKTCPHNAFAASGTSCGSSEMTECTGQDTCDGFGSCLDNHEQDGKACGAPETQCSFASSCSVGECVFGGHKSMSTPCGDYAGDACDVQDYCDGNGSCDAQVKPSTAICREATGECDITEYCDGSSKLCPQDVFKPMSASCGTVAGPCDEPDHCDGKGGCVDVLSDNMKVCRAAASECDVEEKCTGLTKECPADSFAESGKACGNMNLEYCEIQDTCDGSGSCVDHGVEEKEYTFKCGTHNYFCGDDVLDIGCNDGAKSSSNATPEECAGMIQALNDPTVNIYAFKCPNGNAVSHYVRYDCQGVAGYKYELESCSDSSYGLEDCPGDKIVEKEIVCGRRFLRNAMPSFFGLFN